MVRRVVLSLTLLAVSFGGPITRATADPEGVWLAGDLHVHTIWSKDVCETPTMKNTRDASKPNEPCGDPTTWGHTPGEQLQLAQERGLDFLALTDHNTNRHLSDPDVTTYRGPLVVVPGTEFTLDGGEGHAGLLGWLDGKPEDPTPGDGHYTAADMQAIADLAHSADALFSINHPVNPAWGLGYPDADSVEVWNYPWYSQVLPIVGSDPTMSVAWWERNYIAQGRHAAAVGGSDNHWRSTERVQGVGQPTTWVFARDRSMHGVLDAIRAGRTTVSAEPPASGGARLWIDADADGDGVYEAMVGETVAAGATRIRVRATGGAGNILRLVVAGERYETLLTENDATVTYDLPLASGAWARAELFVPDLSGPRADACATYGVQDRVEDVNRALVDVVANVIPAAREVRPIDTGPCAMAYMSALTSPIYAA